MNGGRPRFAWGVLLPALVLFVVGLLVDVSYTGARRNEVRRLAERRDALKSQLASLEGREERTQAIAQRLGGDDLSTALGAQQGLDPVNFLGRTLSESGLHSLELGTEGASQTAQVRCTHYFIRAEGDYDGLQRFLQRIERGPRVLSVDGFTVEREVGVNLLDIRVNLSLYEPLVRL